MKLFILLFLLAACSCQKEIYENYIPEEENTKDYIWMLEHNQDGCCDILLDTIHVPSDTIGWDGYYILGTFEDPCTGHVNDSVYMGPGGFGFMKIGSKYCNQYHY